MTRIAIYPSVLYGADFIAESIASIRPFVSAIYVVLMRRPWGGTDGVMYRGKWVAWPERFDETRLILKELRHGLRGEGGDAGIHVLDDDAFSPWNRWGHAVNDVVRLDVSHPFADGRTEVVLLDPDCVFHEQEAPRIFAEWEAHPEWTWAQPRQVELWKTPGWQVVRPDRSMVTLARGDLMLLSDAVRKARGVSAPTMHRLAGAVHNLGFACSERTLYWKHLTAMAFSPVIKESIPNPDWYENKWLHWTPETRNLEISLGCEGAIPCAVPYDARLAPASVRRRFGL